VRTSNPIKSPALPAIEPLTSRSFPVTILTQLSRLETEFKLHTIIELGVRFKLPLVLRSIVSSYLRRDNRNTDNFNKPKLIDV
jgi:hypothetical protein